MDYLSWIWRRKRERVEWEGLEADKNPK